MNVDIRGIEPIRFVRQSLVRSNSGAPKPKFTNGFGGFIASIPKPECMASSAANAKTTNAGRRDAQWQSKDQSFFISGERELRLLTTDY